MGMDMRMGMVRLWRVPRLEDLWRLGDGVLGNMMEWGGKDSFGYLLDRMMFKEIELEMEMLGSATNAVVQ